MNEKRDFHPISFSGIGRRKFQRIVASQPSGSAGRRPAVFGGPPNTLAALDFDDPEL